MQGVGILTVHFVNNCEQGTVANVLFVSCSIVKNAPDLIRGVLV